MTQFQEKKQKKVYGQIIDYLIIFVKKNQITVRVTFPNHENNIKNTSLKEMVQNKASTVLSYYNTPYTAELNLEKHQHTYWALLNHRLRA